MKNILRRYRLLFFGLLFCPFLVLSQYSYKEEKVFFSENVVSDVAFGTFKKDGFLYVATQKGLYLYDGYIFVKDKNIGNGVQHFYTDSKTIFLEETGVGMVSIKNVYSEKKILQKVVYTDSDEDNDHFTNIYKDPFGNIWCSDFHNVKFLNSQNQLTSFPINKDNKHLGLEVKYFPIKDGLLIISHFGIFLWNKDKRKTLKKISTEKITSSVLYKGKIYVTKNNNTVHEFSLPEKKLKERVLDTNENRFVQNISDGTPLISYNQNSVYELDFQKHSKRLIYTSEEKINHIFYDQKFGIFWISTQNGLIKLIREKNIIKNIELPKTGIITSIVETEKNILWFSDNDGNIFRKNGNSTRAFHIGEKTYQMSFSDGNLLIGTENGIYSIDPKNEKASFQKIISTSEKIKKALLHHGKIWTIPESGKIGVYDAKTFREIPNFIKNYNESYYDTILYNDIIINNGKIWIASWMPKDYGISWIDEKSQQLKQISKRNHKNPELVADHYTRVNLLNDGTMIFSAYGGWNIISGKGKIIKSIFLEYYGNVADYNIQGMVQDDTGNIWFGCAEGLYRYNEKNNNIIRISRKDGLASNNLVYGFLMSQGNQLYFSTEKSVQKIDLNALQKIKLFDELKITGTKIDNQFIPDISNKIEVAESSAQKIDIYFSVLNFWGKDKIKYRYRFGNENWKELGEEPRLSLIKLGHGNYNIEIEAYDDLDGSHKKQLHLKLNIIPPFYKTIWFIGLLAVCIIFVVISISRYFVKKEKQQGMLMKKMKENENKMLRSQMNPHFLFNSLNSINSFIIQNKQHEASRYLTSFSKLMRKILDNSRKDLITLKDELEAVKLYLDLEAVRLEYKFDYSIIIDKNIHEEDIVIPALVLQPFLENSVWHGIHPKAGNGFIEITINKGGDDENPFLNIKIEDNGIGRTESAKRKKEKLHKSHGMDITLERLKMNDPRNKVQINDLYTENNDASGTNVELKIYYNHD